jgi:hypothetical protein
MVEESGEYPGRPIPRHPPLQRGEGGFERFKSVDHILASEQPIFFQQLRSQTEARNSRSSRLKRSGASQKGARPTCG